MAKAVKRPAWLHNAGYTNVNSYKPKNPGQVLTVPNLSFSIPEIIARFERGQSIPVKVEQTYTGDSEDLTGQDVRTWDITELFDYSQKLSEKAAAAEGLARKKEQDSRNEKMLKTVKDKLKQRLSAEAKAAGVEGEPEWIEKALEFKD